MLCKAIAIAGNDEAGKTTIANKIKELYDNRNILCYKSAFADEVKEQLNESGINMIAKPYSNAKRQLIRSYAEVLKEEYGEDYWAKRTINYLKSYDIPKRDVLLVDDMRFNIELDTWIQSFDDYIIIVLTNNIPKYDYNSHESVIQVNDIIHRARLGKIPNTVLINNIHTTNGILPAVVQQLEEHLFGTFTNKTSEDLQ